MKDNESLEHVSSFCFYAAIAFGIFSGIIMIIFRRPILTLLGADAETMPYALPYFTWFAAGAPFVLLSFIHSNLLRAEGLSKDSMMASASGSVVNIVLDPILIFGFNMGAAGAAIATILGFCFTDLYSLIVVLRKSNVLSVDYKKWKISADHASQIFTIGFTAALANITQSFCLILTNHSLLTYGNDKIAVMGIVQKVSMIVMLVIVGFSFGGAPFIGYTYGSRNKPRLKKLLWFILKFLCLTALVLSAILILLAPYVIKLFLKEEVLINTGVLMLRTQVMGIVFMAVVQFLTVYFQAIGKALPALILALSRQGIIFALVLAVLVPIAGYMGIILAQFFAEIISAAIALILLFINKSAFTEEKA